MRTVVIEPDIIVAIRDVVNYNWSTEETDHEQQDRADRVGHIFVALRTLRRWLESPAQANECHDPQPAPATPDRPWLAAIDGLDRLAEDTGVKHGESCLNYLAATIHRQLPAAQAVIVDLSDFYENPDEHAVECVGIVGSAAIPDCEDWNGAEINSSTVAAPLWTETDVLVGDRSLDNTRTGSGQNLANEIDHWVTKALKYTQPGDLPGAVPLHMQADRRLWHITLPTVAG